LNSELVSMFVCIKKRPTTYEPASITPASTTDAMDKLISLMEPLPDTTTAELPAAPVALSAPIEIQPSPQEQEPEPLPHPPNTSCSGPNTPSLPTNSSSTMPKRSYTPYAFLVSPGIFQRYAQEHPQIATLAKAKGQQDWQWLQKHFEKLSIHLDILPLL